MSIKSVKNKTRSGSLLIGNAPFIPTDFESIATAISNGTETSITLSSIPSTYKHLQVRVLGRNNIAAADASFAFMQVNGDTGSNYTRHELWGDGTSVNVSGAASTTGMQYATIVRNNATSGIFGVSIIDIQDYANTTRNKTFRFLTGNDRNGAGLLALFSGAYLSTNAISSLTFVPNNIGGAQTFISGTTFSLYGIKG